MAPVGTGAATRIGVDSAGAARPVGTAGAWDGLKGLARPRVAVRIPCATRIETRSTRRSSVEAPATKVRPRAGNSDPIVAAGKSPPPPQGGGFFVLTAHWPAGGSEKIPPVGMNQGLGQSDQILDARQFR